MNQIFLTTNSVIAIKHFEKQDFFYLGNKSFIRSQVSLTKNPNARDFQNSLFYIEVQGNHGQFDMSIEFQQSIMLRHKVSNKYLSFSEEFQEEINDTTYRLELNQNKYCFKILPCFQYQTKISSKVKFNEDVYLASQINNAKMGFVSTRESFSSQYKRTVLGLNYKSKFLIHNYQEVDKQKSLYTFGSIFWLSHIESSTFLTNCQIQQRQNIMFQQIQPDKQIQTISGVWLLQSQRFQIGGKLHFQQKFMLKNLYSGSYLSFSKNFKLVNNEKIYNFTLEEVPNQFSKFVFKSLKKGQQNIIKKGSYLVFKHYQTGTFIGCRKKKAKDDSQFIKPLLQIDFSDEDLFKIIEMTDREEEAIRFLVSIKQELFFIRKKLQIIGKNSVQQMLQIYQLFENIQKQLKKLQPFDKLFQTVQKQIIKYIQDFSINITQFRKRDPQKQDISHNHYIPRKILKCIYDILTISCKHNRLNQEIAWKYIHYYIDDLYFDIGSEELLIAIFENNYSLLCKVPNNLGNLENKNIVKVITQYILKHTNDKNLDSYWINIQKILNLLMTFIFLNKTTIDINQRLISEELFENRMFDQIFFPIKISNQRIKAKIPKNKTNNFTDIQQIKDPVINQIIQSLFCLFSSLCTNRNFIAKRFINKYLNFENKQGPSILIAYLNIPISKRLSNNIYSLITNLYVDSCPRINRFKPLAIVNFVFNTDLKSSQGEEGQISSRLRQALLLKVQQSYRSRPLQISNLLILSLNLQPTLPPQQLDDYKEQLNQQVITNNWSQELLHSMIVLLRLQCYQVPEIIQIFQLLIRKLSQKSIPNDITTNIMELFNQIFIYTQELQLKKLTSYLKYKYKKKQFQILSSDIPFLLPQSEKLSTNVKRHKKDGEKYVIDKKQLNSLSSKQQFNNIQQTLQKLEPSQNLKKTIIQIFVQKQKQKNIAKQRFLFRVFLNFNRPKYNYLKILKDSIIVTNDDAATFQILFDIYKKMQHLVSISEYWLCNNEDGQQDIINFFKYIEKLTNYFYQDYSIKEDPIIKRNKNQININRQLTIRNLGAHLIILELLETNFYLLEVSTKKSQIKKNQILTFQKCFIFLQSFCCECKENKKILHDNWNILNKFKNLVQIGQTQVYIEMFNNEKDFIKEVKPSFFSKIIKNIIKNVKIKSNQICEFDPNYLKLFQILTKINGASFKPNLQKIYKLIQEGVLKKILFIQQKNGRYQMCLDMNLIKKQPLQVPFIYHSRILKLFNLIISDLESLSSSFKFRIQNIIGLQYLLQVLGDIDIYSHTGIKPQLNFLVKKQVIKLATVFLDKNDNITKLYRSQALIKLLTFYEQIFIIKSKKTQISTLNQALYINHLLDFKRQLNFYEHNQREFYLNDVKPFLSKIATRFQKFPHHQQSNVYKFLIYLIQNIRPENLTQNLQLKKQKYNIQNIHIRWRNFVDKDLNNSQQQKFAKKSVLQILRNSKTETIIRSEQKTFYKLIKDHQNDFMISISQLLKMLMDEEITEDEPQRQVEQIGNILGIIAGYLQNLQKKQILQVLPVIQQCQLIQTLIQYSTNIVFDFNKINFRKIFFMTLRIFNKIMLQDDEMKVLKLFYKYFQENFLSYRFFEILNSCIVELSDRVISDRFFDQINYALLDLHLCTQDKKIKIDKQALAFISNLCNFTPFTTFLRFQPKYPSIDFLQKIYTSLNFILYQQTTSLKITVFAVDATEEILQAISSMLTGGNTVNQNYIIDNKYPQIINDVLRIQSLKQTRNQGQLNQRNRLLEEVIQFYHQNGIDISEILQSKIRIIDFKHIYLLNRLKQTLLKTLLECVAGNQRVFQKIKLQIPVQFLKINLIWIYQDFKQAKHQYNQEIVLRKKQEWEKIIEDKSLNGLFLLIGFYFYILIDSYTKFQQEKTEEEDDLLDDKQKNKQKIVKKFFDSISLKQKEDKGQKSLQKQPFAEQMKQFYQKYYLALDFFKLHTLTIQINILGSLSRVYFPKIPLCFKLTQQAQQQFKIQTNRISQQEKIKSLIEFANESYEQLQEEEQFFQNLEANHPALAVVIKSMKYQSEFLFIAWILAVIETFLFLIDNYTNPTWSFYGSMFVLPSSNFIQILMFIIVIFNIYLALCLFVLLFSRKIPVQISLLKRKYQQQNIAEESGIMSSKIVYVAANTLKNVAYILLVSLFLFATFLHPLFAGFLLIEILTRLDIGKQIIKAIKQTWKQLFVATLLLVIINLFYSMFTFVVFAQDFSPTCESFYQCLLFLLDQSLKNGSGFLGAGVDTIPDANGQSRISFKFLCDILYIVFAQMVVLNIFSGTIIDKFSQLRQETEQMQEDEESFCYICAQERFKIDFQLQGFQKHREITHKTVNYIFYIYYLKRVQKKNYGIVQKYVFDCLNKNKRDWIPDQTSIFKQEKQKTEQKDDQVDTDKIYKDYYIKKSQQTKKLKLKIEEMIKGLKFQDSS